MVEGGLKVVEGCFKVVESCLKVVEGCLKEVRRWSCRAPKVLQSSEGGLYKVFITTKGVLIRSL